MKISNNTDFNIIALFIDEFSSKLSEILPDKKIIVISEKSKECHLYFGNDVQKQEPIVHNMGYILYNKTVCESYDFTKEETFALLSHEIGHFVNNKRWGRNEDQQENEFAADEFVCQQYNDCNLVDGLYKIFLKCELTEEEKQKIRSRIDRACRACSRTHW